LTALLPPINRARFAQIMGVATLCAAAAAGGIAWAAEGGNTTTTLVIVGLVIASLLPSVVAMLGPSFISDEAWGLSVLGTCAMRTMLAMGAMLLLIEMVKLPREPVVFGLLAGAMILTLTEAGLAVWQLQRREAARAGQRPLTQSTDTPSPQAAASSPMHAAPRSL
jgi:hypothetical protein